MCKRIKLSLPVFVPFRFFSLLFCLVIGLQNLAAMDNGKDLFNGSLPTAKLKELLAEIDPTPAEREMNKIIRYVSYSDPALKEAIIEQIWEEEKVDCRHFSEEQLREHLIKQASQVIEHGSLNIYLGDLLQKIQVLQKTIGDFSSSQEDFRKKLKSELQGKESKIQELEKKNKILFIISTVGAVGTISTLALYCKSVWWK